MTLVTLQDGERVCAPNRGYLMPANTVELQSFEVRDAPLPAVYENAVVALAECSRIDECQSWANKAQALASYARQAKDDRLRRMADRIQARASRRVGELLKQIPPAGGKRTDIQPSQGALTRLEAATEAGLSRHQRNTALNVASVPESEFEALVESDDPPTVTALARLGTKPRALVDLGGIDPEDYKRATEAQGTLRRFAEFCASNAPEQVARGFKPHEIAGMRKYVATVDAWLDRFVVSLPEG